LNSNYSAPSDATVIRDMLARLSLSQRAAAEQLDVSARDMRAYCAGKTVPKVVMLALARLLHLQRSVGDPEMITARAIGSNGSPIRGNEMAQKFAVQQSVVMYAANRFACVDRDDDSLIRIAENNYDPLTVTEATKLRDWLTSVLPARDSGAVTP
jgi:hypothetical protein